MFRKKKNIHYNWLSDVTWLFTHQVNNLGTRRESARSPQGAPEPRFEAVAPSAALDGINGMAIDKNPAATRVMLDPD